MTLSGHSGGELSSVSRKTIDDRKSKKALLVDLHP
jgi:hypothetical protein